MPQSVARVATDRPTRYLKQLCSHFSNRVNTHYDDGAGRIDFPFGEVTGQSGDGVLVLSASAPDDASLDRVQDVAGGHLVRFGAKDELHVDWRRQD